ncbi:hypothetical protein RND81_12G039500 [Saponaria officinalis]|uniref:Uncharacterized protein n=1 Tax=Saponaria officinalis TaxID=3572 RepID=A0AAW1H2Y6_SAPOF
MTHFQKLRLNTVLRWVSFNLSLNVIKSPKYQIYRHNYQCVNNCCRLFGSVALNVELNENNGENVRRISRTVKKEVESVLLDYLHCTRCLLFSDAEHMCKNSPHFVKKLVENVRHEPDVRRSMARFLSYHPINEFEPFFESIGLEPSEIAPLLPRNLMFLSDEDGLLDNYHVLCEYGVKRVKLGKMYKEAKSVFRYESGILLSKLRALEEVGISKDVVVRVVCCNPTLLVRCLTNEFFELVRKLDGLGCENSWVEQRLVETTTYNWRQITHLLMLLHDVCGNDEEIRKLVNRLPGILFDHSGRSTLSLMGFLLKFGSSKTDICSFLLRFPQVKVEKFVWNLRRAFELLSEIEMDAMSIGRLVREHFSWMGTCTVKKANSILSNLNTGKKHMCQIVMANPMELKNWTLRAKIGRLTDTREMRSRRDKIKFLTSIGFTENLKEIEKALTVFRGKPDELPRRFNCLVKAGLNENDVSRMIKAAPQILNQSIEVLEAKISVLVNELGYPVSSVKSFPGFLSYTTGRVKLRCAMYRWLIDQKAVRSTLSLSTIIGCTEAFFSDKYVSRHPRGPEVWQNIKQTFSSI